ncbi:MAG TPA: 4-hydroxythreonine-4-phosphate dehydrogenase PdxA [Candidatus Polarisedimenticolia bacterium]|nr:4-hydroxythreonine-4-phosphate dehydrogenase PdxA [Candidatus Polarisedimenticolia bacterium]
MLDVCRPLLIGDHAHLLREAARLRGAGAWNPHTDGVWADVGDPDRWPEVAKPAFDEIGSKQGAEFVVESWKEGPAFHDMGALDPDEPAAAGAPAGTDAAPPGGGPTTSETEAGRTPTASGTEAGRGPTASGGRASVKYIKQAVGLLRTGAAAALVTAPISKTSLRLASIHYPGHTELLADLSGAEQDEVVMLFVTPQYKTALLSMHLPLKEAISGLNQELIVKRLAVLHVEHGRWFGADPKIGVAALNPHAGEEGLFGQEERDILAPAIDAAREAGIDARGPYPADTIFARAARGEFDCVLALYHDQATIAVKTASFGQAVNMTLGLPFLRTSVDHGTAWDIAGQGKADPSSLVEALRLAARLAPRVHR